MSFDIRRLQDISWRQRDYIAQVYAPYTTSFLNMLCKKLFHHKNAFQENLEYACRNAKHPRDRLIYFHHFSPDDKVFTHTSKYTVTVDDLFRHTDVLKLFERFLGPHFKVRILRIHNPNFDYTISLHFYP